MSKKQWISVYENGGHRELLGRHTTKQEAIKRIEDDASGDGIDPCDYAILFVTEEYKYRKPTEDFWVKV